MNCDNMMAILCHECTHFFMEHYQLNVTDTELNEARTDTMAMLIGFRRQIISGYEETIEQRREGNVIGTPVA